MIFSIPARSPFLLQFHVWQERGLAFVDVNVKPAGGGRARADRRIACFRLPQSCVHFSDRRAQSRRTQHAEAGDVKSYDSEACAALERRRDRQGFNSGQRDGIASIVITPL
jgi:hypothetical protein